MAVCADKRIGVRNLFTVLVFVRPNGLAEILKVHLVTNTCARRNKKLLNAFWPHFRKV